MKTFSGMTVTKKVLMCFSANVGRHFLKRFFTRIFNDLAQIFDKSKLFGVRLHSLHPRLLHHWLGPRNFYQELSGPRKGYATLASTMKSIA